MWKLGLRPRNSQKRNTKKQILSIIDIAKLYTGSDRFSSILLYCLCLFCLSTVQQFWITTLLEALCYYTAVSANTGVPAVAGIPAFAGAPAVPVDGGEQKGDEKFAKPER